MAGPRRKLRNREDQKRAQEIGARITEARLEAGMTLAELGALIGVSQRSVIAYEHGEVIPYAFMSEIERALNRPAAWFLHGEDGFISTDARLDEILAELRKLRTEVRKLKG